MILLSNEEVITELAKHCYPPPKYWDEIDLTRKAQLKKVEDWLRTLLDDPELEDAKGTIGFIGLTLRGERLRGIE